MALKKAKYWYEEMRDKVLESLTPLRNFNVGSRIRSLLEAVAVGMEEISFEADAEYGGLYASTATGDRLTMRAKELGLTRKAAQEATGICRFTGAEGTNVPSGTKVGTGDPTTEASVKEFETTAAGQIAIGDTYVDIAVAAVVAGSAGNVEAEEVDTMIDTVVGITDVVNPYAISGGCDEELDEDLRHRCALVPYRIAPGIERYWEALAGDVAGVARAKTVSGYAGPGTFKVLVWSRDAEGNLVAGSSSLVTAVQDYLDPYVIACVTLEVAAPAGPIQDVTGYLEVAAGQTHEGVSPYVKAAIEAVFAGLGADEKLTRASLVAAAMGVAYVENFKLAVPNADVTPGTGETILAGLIQILPMEWDTEYGF